MNCRFLPAVSVWLITASGLMADDSEAAARFVAVPDALWSTAPRQGEQFETIKLPSGLGLVLEHYDWGAKPGLPPKLSGYKYDLNNDGDPEYLIATIHGGTGGPDFLIVSRFSGEWQVIAWIQGVIHVIPSGATWQELVIITRGGPESYAKHRWVFHGTQYRMACMESFDHGRITEKDEQP